MRGIVQYEVYVLDQGRWSLHARYPGAQRADAVLDASNTENETGRATKVVRDTYWPDRNENEEVTTYLSPKARTLQALASKRRNAPMTAMPIGRNGVPQNRRRMQQSTALLRNIRLVVALGLSLFFASGLTAALSVVLHRAAEHYDFDQGSLSIVLTICYVLIFAYAFSRTVRARLKIHQIIAEVWESAATPAQKYPPRRAMGRAFRGAPSKPWQSATETRAPRPEPPKVPAPVALEPEPPPPPPPPPAPPVLEAEAEAKKKNEVPPPDDPPELDVEPEEDLSPVAFTPSSILEVPEGLGLERIILRRFAVDVVMPSIARIHRDDPVTRRGITLLLAGAVQGLAATKPITAEGALALLAEALRESGSKAAAIESFLGNYEANITALTALPLLAAGRKAIDGYVAGTKGIDRDIQQALSVWRFPSTARLQPTKPEFYIFSIAREESMTDEDEPTAALLLHQAIVRAAVEEYIGAVVPHDSAGTLARFDDVGSAFAAARAIQNRIAAASGPGTATVIVEGPVTAPGVPEDVASVLDRARALLAVTVDGEVVSDASAHRMLPDVTVIAEPVALRSDAVRVLDMPLASSANP